MKKNYEEEKIVMPKMTVMNPTVVNESSENVSSKEISRDPDDEMNIPDVNLDYDREDGK